MRKFIFIFSIIFSNLSFSGESIEIFLYEQHKNLFGYIEKNIELIDEDRNLFIAGFEKSIEDLIDPREISKRVMGKKIYQLSSKEQIDMFNFKFRNTLFESYSSALKELSYENLKIVSHSHPNERMDLAVVQLNTEFSGRKFRLIYKMKKLKLEDLKEWRVIGIVIDGIDLVSLYRKQFASLVKENDDNLDLAISSWSIDEESITLDE